MGESTTPTETPHEQAACGWFGKIACLGDFASRRLPPECVQAWDDWLSAGLVHSRDELGALWLEAYLAAPVWRWLQAPDAEGGTWWSGVWMPSVDQVGRYFPLVLLRAEPGPPVAAAQWVQLEQDLDLLARCALQSLSPEGTLDSFDAQVQALPSARTQTPTQADDKDLLAWVLAHQAEAMQGHSLWWTKAADGHPVIAQLRLRWPPAGDFKRLLVLP